jgi:vacuolar-type H+-ATPase subunit E/Vma4
MNLDAILHAIRESGEVRVRAIEERAQAEINRIMAEAEQEANVIQQQARKTASNAMIADSARVIHQARLEAMRLVGDTQQAIVEQALESVRLRLESLRTESDYPDLLHRLLQEALDVLEGSLYESEQACVQADPRDRTVLERVLREMSLSLPVLYTLEHWGGVCVTSPDGRIVVDNTLETRLIRAAPYLYQFLPTLLEHTLNSVSETARTHSGGRVTLDEQRTLND